MLSPELLEKLVCPKCHNQLEYKTNNDPNEGDWLICHVCHQKYTVVDDIPNLVIDDAQPV